MLTVKEVAKAKGLSYGRIIQLIKAGAIKATKVGRDWAIKQKDLDEARWDTKPGPKGKGK